MIAGGHGGWFPQSDVFITLVTCVFSVASGYLAVLSYEYAAAAGETKAAQAYAGTRMNTAFQIATFTSVVAGVAVRWMVLVLKVAELGVSCTSRGFDGTPRARNRD